MSNSGNPGSRALLNGQNETLTIQLMDVRIKKNMGLLNLDVHRLFKMKTTPASLTLLSIIKRILCGT